MRLTPSALPVQGPFPSLLVLLPAVFNDFLHRFPVLREEMSRCWLAQSESWTSRYQDLAPNQRQASRRSSSSIVAQGINSISCSGAMQHAATVVKRTQCMVEPVLKPMRDAAHRRRSARGLHTITGNNSC